MSNNFLLQQLEAYKEGIITAEIEKQTALNKLAAEQLFHKLTQQELQRQREQNKRLLEFIAIFETEPTMPLNNAD